MLHFLLYQIAQIDLLSQYAFYRYCRPQPLLELRISFPVLSFCICRWMLYSVGFQVDCDSVRTIASRSPFKDSPHNPRRFFVDYRRMILIFASCITIRRFQRQVFSRLRTRCSNCSNFLLVFAECHSLKTFMIGSISIADVSLLSVSILSSIAINRIPNVGKT